MIRLPKNGRVSRHLLLAGTMLAICGAATPALAQLVDADAAGTRVLVNEQSLDDAPASAEAHDAVSRLEMGGVSDTHAELSANEIAIAARGNRATQSLAVDALNLAGPEVRTYLSTGGTGVTADASAAMASSQRAIASPVHADIRASRETLRAARVQSSRLDVAGNADNATALANENVSTLTLSGAAGGTGIVTSQVTDWRTSVGARSIGRTDLVTRGVSDSELSLSGNARRAIGYGNSTDNVLAASRVGVGAGAADGGEPALLASASGEELVADSAHSILSDQQAAGAVETQAGGLRKASAFGITLQGSVDASTVGNADNVLVAAGYGNRSRNRLSLQATSLEGGGAGDGIAEIHAVQRLTDAETRSNVRNFVSTDVRGDASGARLSVSGNSARAVASGNIAEGNLLEVDAGNVTAPSSTTRAPMSRSIGGEDATSQPALSIRNVQDVADGSIAAGVSRAPAMLKVAGSVDRTDLRLAGNESSAAAGGNSVTSAIDVAANTLQAGVGLDNLQTGSAGLSATVGAEHDPAGAVVTVRSPIAASRVDVSDNELAGSAIGNSATGSLAVETNSLLAGDLLPGAGGASALGLANEQRVGAAGSEPVPITASILGRFGVVGDSEVDGSSIFVRGNAQQSTALANLATNRLTVSTVSLSRPGSPEAVASLSSTQFGGAEVSARSTMRLGANDTLAGSSLGISGNSNRSLAAINDAGNGVEFTDLGSGDSEDVGLRVPLTGQPEYAGDHLANMQTASGSSRAAAATWFDAANGDSRLSDSQMVLEGNLVSADAAANRALNTITRKTGPAEQAGAALGNVQSSDAAVTASATFGTVDESDGSERALGIGGSQVTIADNGASALARGNVAENRLTLGGTVGFASSGSQASIHASGLTLHGPAVLLNLQQNSGPVAATAGVSGFGSPLNQAGAAVGGSSIAMQGNAVSAGAYGNAASNTVLPAGVGSLPAAGIVSAQLNSGAVSAQVNGTGFRAVTGPVTASTISISGNQLAATATGNQVVNVLTAPR